MLWEIKTHLSNRIITWLIKHTCINAAVVYATLMKLSISEMDFYCDEVRRVKG